MQYHNVYQCKDLYNREVYLEDYILINIALKSYIDTSYLYLLQVSDYIQMIEDNRIYKYYSNYYNTCYKIESPSKDVIKYYENHRMSHFREPVDSVTDILGRKIKAGDFVFYITSRDFKSLNNLEYGLVVDSNHIFTTKSVIKKIDYVYKIEKRNTQEECIFEDLISDYNKYQTMMLNSIKRELKVGDVYLTNSYLYIYFGELIFEVQNDSSSYIQYSNSIKDNINKKHKVYLRLKRTTNKAMDFYRDLKYNWVNEKQISDYISSCGLSNYSLLCLGLPNSYKFDISPGRLGVFKENINLKYKPDSVYVISDKSCVYSIHFYFIDA